MTSTRVASDLETYIGQAYDQALYDGCPVSLNRGFWNEYKEVRCEVASEIYRHIRGREYKTALRTRTVNELVSLGWSGYHNDDGCIEFTKALPPRWEP